jgi:hypothetical protein
VVVQVRKKKSLAQLVEGIVISCHWLAWVLQVLIVTAISRQWLAWVPQVLIVIVISGQAWGPIINGHWLVWVHLVVPGAFPDLTVPMVTPMLDALLHSLGLPMTLGVLHAQVFRTFVVPDSHGKN